MAYWRSILIVLAVAAAALAQQLCCCVLEPAVAAIAATATGTTHATCCHHARAPAHAPETEHDHAPHECVCGGSDRPLVASDGGLSLLRPAFAAMADVDGGAVPRCQSFVCRHSPDPGGCHGPPRTPLDRGVLLTI